MKPPRNADPNYTSKMPKKIWKKPIEAHIGYLIGMLKSIKAEVKYDPDALNLNWLEIYKGLREIISLLEEMKGRDEK